MRLACEELETRDALSAPAVDLGGGVVRIRPRPLFDEVAFPGFTGPLHVAEGVDPTTGRPAVFVGAGDGGGPRLAEFDEETCVRLSDKFVGDPASRSGVIPLPVGLPAVQLIDVPHLTYGPEAGFPVWLDFVRPPSAAFVDEVTRDVAAAFVPLGARVTTDQPDARPGSYGTVVIGAPTRFDGSEVAGYAPAADWGLTPDSWALAPVYVAGGYAAAFTATLAEHEMGHGFGLAHTTDTHNLLYPGPELGAGLTPDQDAAIEHRTGA